MTIRTWGCGAPGTQAIWKQGETAPPPAAGQVSIPYEPSDGEPLPAMKISSDGLSLAPITDIDLARVSVRRQRKAEANAYRLMVAAAGIATPSGHHLQTPPESQLNFVGLVSMAREAKEAGLPFEQPVRMLDNSSIPHNAEQMIALGLLIGRHIAACSAAYFVIADEINASDDPESIDITAGYPVEGAA